MEKKHNCELDILLVIDDKKYCIYTDAFVYQRLREGKEKAVNEFVLHCKHCNTKIGQPSLTLLDVVYFYKFGACIQCCKRSNIYKINLVPDKASNTSN